MRVTKLMVLAGVSLSVLGGPVLAQQNGGFTPQQLDDMSKERTQETGPRNWGPPPPQGSLPKETVIPLDGLWVCMGAQQWQPIYASPNKSSAVIGQTLSQVAVGGKELNSFDPVLVRAGRVGYVQASIVSPYASKLRPGSTCTVDGVQPNGALIFGYH
jgi:hypothetical protein